MGKTSIEWTDASWNPIVGCTEVSPGCANCYAAGLAATRLRYTQSYNGLAVIEPSERNPARVPRAVRWTGEVRFLPERLEEPLHWRKPRKIFVCDMGDLFHEKVQPAWFEGVLDVIIRCPQHTFQILTKRAQRMHDWFDREWRIFGSMANPLPNVWLGVSVENQHFANQRIPLLLSTPVAVRFISAEPLLGLIDLKEACECSRAPAGLGRGLDWVICGGESGLRARPMHPDWARSLRDQCQRAGVPFFFKQWGVWSFDKERFFRKLSAARVRYFEPNAKDGTCLMYRVGKEQAGRLLDGREWREFPKVAQVEAKP